MSSRGSLRQSSTSSRSDESSSIPSSSDRETQGTAQRICSPDPLIASPKPTAASTPIHPTPAGQEEVTSPAKLTSIPSNGERLREEKGVVKRRRMMMKEEEENEKKQDMKMTDEDKNDDNSKGKNTSSKRKNKTIE